MPRSLFDLNPRDDLETLREAFDRTGIVQLRDVLSPQSAQALQTVLGRETPWGLAWQAGGSGARFERRDALSAMAPGDHQARVQAIGDAVRGTGYAYAYSCYPMLDAYRERWAPDGPHDLLLEHINDEPMLALVKSITGATDIVRADAQATLYAPGHFLAMHDDRDDAGGRRVAYVLSLCPPGWRPEWGGYLQFHDTEGDVVSGYRPRFNALNLFRVPRPHSVSVVSPAAPIGRFAITGWFRAA